MDKSIRKIIEFKLKKMHNFEKKLEKMKIQLKPEEKEFFMNYPKFCNDIGRRINAFSNQIHCETKKLFEDIHKAKAAQKDIICPLRKKLAEKEKTIKENSTKKDEKPKREIHWYVTCDGCKMTPLMGKRYKCEVCPNFDYCEKCYEKEKENHKHGFKVVEHFHNYKKFFEELKKKETKDGKAIHFGYICDGCEKHPIIGNRFKCTVCEDFDYCEECEEKFRNEHKHPFLKIYKPTMDPVSIKCVIPGLQKDKK
jgi:hypothetical protein